MKILVVSRGGLELARAHVHKPIVTIGRSPSCDVVLRAPGVEAIHFLLEWVGTGHFNPGAQMWSVFDISKPIDADKLGPNQDSGEGIVVFDKPVELGGFLFQWKEDALSSKPVIGGTIEKTLREAKGSPLSVAPESSVMEVVQVRVDSGAIEEVRHISVSKRRKVTPLKRVPELKIEWNGTSPSEALRVLLQEMPGALVRNRGQTLSKHDFYKVSGNDVLQIRWQEHDFYVRFVSKVDVPEAPREIFQDPLLLKLTLAGGALILLVAVLAKFPFSMETPKVPEPPRVARVEVKEIAEAKPVEEAPPPPPPVKAKPDPAGLHVPGTSKNPGRAAAPRFKTAPGPSHLGLNSPAPQGKTNAIGILGAMGSGAKGKGVRADKIINDGVVTDAVSADSDTTVVVRNPPAGTIGTGNGGDPHGKGTGLEGASTTLSGAGKYNPDSVGPIARKGGKSGYSVGTALSGAGSGVGRGNEIGSMSVGNFTVEGGLDKETVRRVIAGYRSQIRTCYERALIPTPRLGGRVLYTWHISPTGPVSSAEITQTATGSPVLDSCVLEVIRSMQFPAAPNGKATTVIYPFLFQQKVGG